MKSEDEKLIRNQIDQTRREYMSGILSVPSSSKVNLTNDAKIILKRIHEFDKTIIASQVMAVRFGHGSKDIDFSESAFCVYELRKKKMALANKFREVVREAQKGSDGNSEP